MLPPMHPLPADHPIAQAAGLWHPTAPRRGAVVLFRQVIGLGRARRGVRLAITASHRYELRLGGRTLARGPSRSDPARWGVRMVALPPLAAGRHVLAVVVAHDGDGAGESQLGPDGFLSIVGLGAAAGLVDPEGWSTWHDTAVGPCDEDGWNGRRRYAPIGAHERFAAAAHPWGWERPGYRPTGWLPARRLRPAADVWGNLGLGVQLVPETLPPMRETPLAWSRLAAGPPQQAARWLAGGLRLRIPPRSTRRWVLDRGASGVHWPTLTWSGGAGAEIRLTWVEAPCDADGRLGPREVVVDCHLRGHRDLLLPDGGRDRRWTPRWLRTGRYLVLEVTTGATPLTLAAPRLAEAGFPFTRRLRLDAGPAWPRLLEVTDRTLRSCAHECIWDCPHYEQCQFPGDARVQAVAHYLLYGDDRLARKALRDFADAQRPDGLIPCRAPARSPQRIDTFTLQWVLMLGEFLEWRGDTALVRELLPAARHALEPFLAGRRGDGLIGGGMVAPFVDWSPGFTAGNAPQDRDGGSAIIALLAAQACRAMARLEMAAGWPEAAPRWRREAGGLVAAVRRTCLRDGMVRDTPRGPTRSVHAQVEAVQAGLLSGRAARAALAATIDADGVSQPGTRFYTWHLGAAWFASGRPDRALDLIAGWERQLAAIPGLATWPESDGLPRSDCHGWGAYPVLAGASMLLGVRPAAPGMTEVRIAPHLPGAGRVAGRVPTPHGPVEVVAERDAAGTVTIAYRSPVPVLIGTRRRPAGTGRAALAIGSMGGTR